MQYRRIGIIGGGVIGKALFDHIANLEGVAVDYVLVADRHRSGRSATMAAVAIDDAREALARKVDLVLEAATPDLLASLGPELLGDSDLCGFSCSALAAGTVETTIREAAAKNGRRFFVPHGAILGLDGLVDGREQIDRVVITTTKSGASLGLAANATGILFEGSTREACVQFPRNVNVHAAVALAGIGFDRTRSVVVADPTTKAMRHHIAVSGKGLEWEISVSSVSLGGVTGVYTPTSAIGSLHRILGRAAFAVV